MIDHPHYYLPSKNLRAQRELAERIRDGAGRDADDAIDLARLVIEYHKYRQWDFRPTTHEDE